MALKDVVKNLEEKQFARQHRPCYYATFYKTLSKEDQKTLDELISKGISSRIIVSLLLEEGYKIGIEKFNDHRFSRCRCPKESK